MGGTDDVGGSALGGVDGTDDGLGSELGGEAAVLSALCGVRRSATTNTLTATAADNTASNSFRIRGPPTALMGTG
ncbi:hypothetical protein MINT15_00860 [Saccharomonospora viridis]|uniref:Uncharacterized protein n=1 Tax=Saccharomonospora viridis TaxID=1852 RepID=A0A837DEZ2_9PSEU|nr:hypothetical protein MINT15_00860 [Saccharomonospora viridis]